MKNNRPSSNKNPRNALYAVVYLENSTDTITRIRNLEPLYKKTPMDKETLLTFVQVVRNHPPSSTKMQMAIERIQPPPLRKKNRADYRMQRALQQLACGEIVRMTEAMMKHLPTGLAKRLNLLEDSGGRYTMTLTHGNMLAVFRALLLFGWGFPPVGETDFKGWPRIFNTPYGGWGENEGSEFYDH
jgi:hypothetical protein